jgi:hypothetical protein
MNQLPTFQEFIASQNIQIAISDFLINMMLSVLFAYLLSIFYIRYGKTLSNRRLFAGTFILITLTTMVVITIVKSSLALSLGLVGALSIVRFRTAIKEPEELSYIFICIAIGLGLGANQRIIVSLVFPVFLGVILLYSYRRTTSGMQEHLYFLVSGGANTGITLTTVLDLIKDHCTMVNLKRFEDSETGFEAYFQIELKDAGKIESLIETIRELDGSIRTTLLDNTGAQ